MLKIPFIECAYLGIEITREEVRWFEVDRLGKRMSLKSSGEFLHNNGDVSFNSAIENLKEQLISDTFFVGVSIPEALMEIFIEEIPYSEEPEEVDRWISSKEKELFQDYDSDRFLIQHHIIELDEDSKRCIFQVIDEKIVSRYKALLAQLEVYPKYINAGVFEVGYSQIYNPLFIEGVSSVLQAINQRVFLTVFEYGLIKNVYEINLNGKEDAGFLLQEADSYLQSEESSTDQALNSIPIFISVKGIEIRANDGITDRDLAKISPFDGKKGYEALSNSFASTSGIIAKLVFPDLDGFNYSNQSEIEQATIFHDKKEALRLSVLLFVPLVFFTLITYAFGKVVDHRLVESNQIMNQIGDKIDDVTAKRTILLQTKDQFIEAQAILREKELKAYIFELIADHIPGEMWLAGMEMTNNNSSGDTNVGLTGFSSSDGAISSFLNKLENSDQVVRAALIVSEKVEEGSNRNLQGRTERVGATRFEIKILFS